MISTGSPVKGCLRVWIPWHVCVCVCVFVCVCERARAYDRESAWCSLLCPCVSIYVLMFASINSYVTVNQLCICIHTHRYQHTHTHMRILPRRQVIRFQSPPTIHPSRQAFSSYQHQKYFILILYCAHEMRCTS